MKRIPTASFSARVPARVCSAAFSLVEIMVAVALMSIIILGLMAMFSQTQKAFRAGITQVDIMEGGRAALEMTAREMEQAAPTKLPLAVNFFASWNGYALIQSLPGTAPAPATQQRTNVTQNVVFTTRENQNWQAVGYSVVFNNSSVGTLYRFETNASQLDAALVALLGARAFDAPSNRVVDGVVHFRVLAYDPAGQLITPAMYYVSPTNGISALNNVPGELSYGYDFRSNAVPAYLEIEIGLLEQKITARARNLGFDSSKSPADASQPQIQYLQKHASAVQVFRQRVPIPNVDPEVYQ